MLDVHAARIRTEPDFRGDAKQVVQAIIDVVDDDRRRRQEASVRHTLTLDPERPSRSPAALYTSDDNDLQGRSASTTLAAIPGRRKTRAAAQASFLMVRSLGIIFMIMSGVVPVINMPTEFLLPEEHSFWIFFAMFPFGAVLYAVGDHFHRW